jgi:hypothetical protein
MPTFILGSPIRESMMVDHMVAKKEGKRSGSPIHDCVAKKKAVTYGNKGDAAAGFRALIKTTEREEIKVYKTEKQIPFEATVLHEIEVFDGTI